MKRLQLPLSREALASLKAGDEVLLTGVLYTGRDAAHQRLYQALQEGRPLPVDLRGQTIYYVGPAPARPGAVIGPAGPTSSYRMDPYTPALLDAGLVAMIGKGRRSDAVREAKEPVCYEDLGTEAVYRLEVKNFYAIVGIDSQGNSLV